MGYFLDDWEYGDNCAICFPAGQTPKYLMVSFTGILPGEFYDPAIYPPIPNRLFKLEQKPFDPCRFEFRAGDYWVVFNIGGYNTTMSVLNYSGAYIFFIAGPLPACKWAGQNNYQDPGGRITYKGRYQIAWLAPVGTVSLRNAVEAMGFDPDDDIVIDWFPFSNTQMVVRVVRVQDHSCVSAKHAF